MMSKSRVRSLKRVWLTVLPVFLLGVDGAGDATENKAVSAVALIWFLKLEALSFVLHFVHVQNVSFKSLE